jgi:hypothetical protein
LNRFEYERLVHASAVQPLTRLVLLVLAQATNSNTLVIPDKFMPSIETLAARTGMGPTALRTHLRNAVAAGWLEWSRGGAQGRGDRSKFVLLAPDMGSRGEPISTNEGSPREPIRRDMGSRGEPIRAEKGSYREPTHTKNSIHQISTPARSRASVAGSVRSAFPDATDEEIEIIARDRQARGARSVSAVLQAEIADGTIRLPCDVAAETRHSSECRIGDGPGKCSVDWCQCRCHVKPKDTR